MAPSAALAYPALIAARGTSTYPPYICTCYILLFLVADCLGVDTCLLHAWKLAAEPPPDPAFLSCDPSMKARFLPATMLGYRWSPSQWQTHAQFAFQRMRSSCWTWVSVGGPPFPKGSIDRGTRQGRQQEWHCCAPLKLSQAQPHRWSVCSPTAGSRATYN